jgi:hypothetical protein
MSHIPYIAPELFDRCPQCSSIDLRDKIRQYAEVPGIADVGWQCGRCSWQFGFECSESCYSGEPIELRPLAIAQLKRSAEYLGAFGPMPDFSTVRCPYCDRFFPAEHIEVCAGKPELDNHNL